MLDEDGLLSHAMCAVLMLMLLLLSLLCSLEKQVAFSTALMLDWCGATPVGTAQQVLQELLAG